MPTAPPPATKADPVAITLAVTAARLVQLLPIDELLTGLTEETTLVSDQHLDDLRRILTALAEVRRVANDIGDRKGGAFRG